MNWQSFNLVQIWRIWFALCAMLIATPCVAEGELSFNVSPKQCIVESEQQTCVLSVQATITNAKTNMCIGTLAFKPLVCFHNQDKQVATLMLTLSDSIELIVFEKNQHHILARASIKKAVLLKDYRRKRRFGWSL